MTPKTTAELIALREGVTPGPWECKATVNQSRGDGASWREIVDQANGSVLAEVFHDQDEDEPFVLDETAAANASAIAALPDVLDLLASHQALAEATGFDDAVEALKAIPAIRKAGFEMEDKLWIARCDSRDEPFQAVAERAIKQWQAALVNPSPPITDEED